MPEIPTQPLAFRRPLMVLIDTALIALSYYGAFFLRFDGGIPPAQVEVFTRTLVWLVAIRLTAGTIFGLHHMVWRYTGLSDLVAIAGASAAGTMIFAGLVTLMLRVGWLPRSIYAIDTLLLVALFAGVRAARRIVHDRGDFQSRKRILIFGAGDAGEMIVRDMKHNPYYGYTPIGFIDDDLAKVGRRIHGVRVLGTRVDVGKVMSSHSPDEVLIAMPSMPPAAIRGIMKALESCRVPVKTLPSLRDVIDGRVSITDIRNVALEDLLGRAPIGLDSNRLCHLLAGQSVLITGAGGSIGSELCRQIWALRPRTMVMYDRYENALYTVEKELRDRGAGDGLVAAIGDICDERRLESLLKRHAVKLIFHAAAHKHVPLMELNPCEAIKNNVRGTRILAETAARCGVSSFVLISTDKAVNPSNVMGASKRIAELLVKAEARRTGLGFTAVRFGNVLGSNGSVVPRFLEQIRSGGPVTVTHPKMQRFFMLIHEAVQLVLHAATLIQPGAIYVLNMGEQIAIADMASHLIRLSGLMPDRDIEIEFTGVRPGEKIQEELIGHDECVEQSEISHVLLLRGGKEPDPEWLSDKVRSMEKAAAAGDADGILGLLEEIIPSFSRSRLTAVEARVAQSNGAAVHANGKWHGDRSVLGADAPPQR